MELNLDDFSPKADSKVPNMLDELLKFILTEFEKIFAEYLLISIDTIKDRIIPTLKTNHCQFLKLKEQTF